ncbi:MAG TPA: SCO family protein [Rhodocyclaceae bacterium]|nr:SCO family protein [Rhodocyclaceae bacterium]
MLCLQRTLGLWALLASLAPAAAGAGEALFSREASDLQAEAQAARSEGKKLAVAFTLPDCPGCREMERTVFQEPAVTARFSRQYRSVKVDLARSEPLADLQGQRAPAADLARRLGAYATPSFAFFDGRGEFLYRSTGTLSAADFQRLGQYVARAGYEQRPFAATATTAKTAAAPRLQADLPGAALPRQPEFQLADTTGRVRRLADFRGQVVALAVGYSQCPDVCPTTLAELKAAVEALPAALRHQVQVLFVTLDPERDSAPLLKDYVAAFHPQGGRPFLGLWGGTSATADFIRELQLVAERQPSASMGYTLDHSAGVYLFDQGGVLRGISPYGQPVSALAADLTQLTRLAGVARPPRTPSPIVANDIQGSQHHVH